MAFACALRVKNKVTFVRSFVKKFIILFLADSALCNGRAYGRPAASAHSLPQTVRRTQTGGRPLASRQFWHSYNNNNKIGENNERENGAYYSRRNEINSIRPIHWRRFARRTPSAPTRRRFFRAAHLRASFGWCFGAASSPLELAGAELIGRPLCGRRVQFAPGPKTVSGPWGRPASRVTGRADQFQPAERPLPVGPSCQLAVLPTCGLLAALLARTVCGRLAVGANMEGTLLEEAAPPAVSRLPAFERTFGASRQRETQCRLASDCGPELAANCGRPLFRLGNPRRSRATLFSPPPPSLSDAALWEANWRPMGGQCAAADSLAPLARRDPSFRSVKWAPDMPNASEAPT